MSESPSAKYKASQVGIAKSRILEHLNIDTGLSNLELRSLNYVAELKASNVACYLENL